MTRFLGIFYEDEEVGRDPLPLSLLHFNLNSGKQNRKCKILGSMSGQSQFFQQLKPTVDLELEFHATDLRSSRFCSIIDFTGSADQVA